MRARANQLAHESVHAIQAEKYPRMPDTVAEKEAYYYQRLTPQVIVKYKDDPEGLYYLINDSITEAINSSASVNAEIN